MQREITIVIRCIEGDNIDNSLESIFVSDRLDFQQDIVIVSTGPIISRYADMRSINLIISDAKRIEAKKIGIENAKYNSILFIDSDQTLSKELLNSLLYTMEEMVIIPERSMNRNFMGKLMDKKRIALENAMKQRIDITIPVIPRLFARDLLLKAFLTFSAEVIKNVTETEDSLIFYECLKYSTNVGWVKTGIIYNMDPSLLEYINKSYTYGLRNEIRIKDSTLSPEYSRIVRAIQYSTILNNNLPSISTFFLNMIRGIPYTCGLIAARIYKRGSQR
ncbi:MAG: hypothetical protein ACYCPR_09030 [Thermoplasmataceae archaeon]